jgi:hypothetical protein
VALSFLIVELAALRGVDQTDDPSASFTFGPEGLRAILSVIASSMITSASLIFSITMQSLQLASSQFVPRVISVAGSALSDHHRRVVSIASIRRSRKCSAIEFIDFLPEKVRPQSRSLRHNPYQRRQIFHSIHAVRRGQCPPGHIDCPIAGRIFTLHLPHVRHHSPQRWHGHRDCQRALPVGQLARNRQPDARVRVARLYCNA